MHKRIDGAIIAAGKGTRIEPLSFKYPKSLLRVCNKPIIEHQIGVMKDIGIKNLFIVVGHLGNYIKKHLKDGRDFGVNITYIEQKNPKGIAHAVAQLESVVKIPFFVFLGDIFIKCRNLKKAVDLLKENNADAVLITKKERNKDMIKKNFSVILNKKGRVVRVIEKPHFPQNNLKGCGVYLFTPAIFDAIRRTPISQIRNEYELTDSIQIFIDDMHPVYSVNDVEWDLNINTAEDLLYCNLKMLKGLNKNKIVGKNVRIHPRAKLINSILCDNAVIKNPIKIINSCIFPNSVVDAKKDLMLCLVSNKTQINLETKFKGKYEI